MEAFLSNPLLPFLVLVLATLLLLAGVWLLTRRLNALLRGKDALSLEEAIRDLGTELAELRKFQEESEAYFASVESRLRRSIQGVETIRFNPWKGTGEGGNQSFATALLDEHGNGVVFSSLHSRERTSVFSKPVLKHESEFELSEEESEALKRLKAKLSIVDEI